MWQTDDDLFDQTLREQAQACMPEFSAVLHERVMRRVELTARVEPARPAMPWRLWAARTSVAAAAVVAVLLTGWLFDRPPTHPKLAIRPADVPPIGAAASLPEMVAQTQIVDRELHDVRFAYLDQDVEAFAGFVRGVLPSAPLPTARPG